ncbi:MAG: hypothetical protein HFG76_14995 [Hungatella sp.]|nr:hypothetical protein [Hungatella sp.]
MKQDLQKEEIEAMMEAPVSGKRVGIVRLQMVREERTLYGMVYCRGDHGEGV